MSRFIPIILTMLLFGCVRKGSTELFTFSEVAEIFGCSEVDTGSSYPLETADRTFYRPEHFEIGNIRTDEKLDGYHGAAQGDFIFGIETYRTVGDAQSRVEEYQDLSRLAGVTDHDENALSKLTVRISAYRIGRQAFLFTTVSAGQFALEQRTGFLKNGIEILRQDQRLGDNG